MSLIASPADCHRLLANSLPVMNITSTARETGNFHVRSTRTNDLCCLRRKLSEAQLRGLYKGTGIRLGPSPGAPLGDALSISAASCRAGQPNDPTHTRPAIQLQFSELVGLFAWSLFSCFSADPCHASADRFFAVSFPQLLCTDTNGRIHRSLRLRLDTVNAQTSASR